MPTRAQVLGAWPAPLRPTLVLLMLAATGLQGPTLLHEPREHLRRREVEEALQILRAELARLDAEGAIPDDSTWAAPGQQRAYARSLLPLGRLDQARRVAERLGAGSLPNVQVRLATGVALEPVLLAESAREIVRLRDATDRQGLWEVLADRDRPREVRLGALRGRAALPGAQDFARDALLGPETALARTLLAHLGGPEVVARLEADLETAPTGERPALFALLGVEGSPAAHAALRRWTSDAPSGFDARARLRACPPYPRREPLPCLVEGLR